jgi:hypothetical protein
MTSYTVKPDELEKGQIASGEIKPEQRVGDDCPPSPFPSMLLLTPLPCSKFHFSHSQRNHKIHTMLSTHMFARAKPCIKDYLHVAAFLASRAEQSSVFNHSTCNTIKEKFLSRTE